MRRPSTTIRRSRWRLGVQHAQVASQPSPLTGGFITVAARRLIATSGPSITGGSTNTAVDVPAGKPLAGPGGPPFRAGARGPHQAAVDRDPPPWGDPRPRVLCQQGWVAAT